MKVLFRIRDVVWPPEATLRELGVMPAHVVLDFGCGPGSYSLAAARLVGPTGRVYAVDVNLAAVKYVEASAQRQGLENIVASTRDSPADLPSCSLDLAIMHDVLHELDSPATVISGIECLLKPNGVFAVSDHHMRGHAIVAAVTSSGILCHTRHFRGVYCFTRRPLE